MLLLHAAFCAAFFARCSAGNSMAARIAIIAITTSNSINVNPFPDRQAFARGAHRLKWTRLSIHSFQYHSFGREARLGHYIGEGLLST